MDDWGYITQNSTVTEAISPLEFWTTLKTTDYWPLTYTFYWLEYRAFGQNPLGYHLINVILHSLNAWLVFVLARELGLGWAWFAALLFLLHPLHVQATAWIAQSKTQLSTLFALLTTVLFLRGRATWAAAAFLLSLLSKTSALFLPFALMLLKRPTNKREWTALVPFFTLAALGGALTLYVNSIHFHDTNFPIFQMPWYERLIFIPQNLAFYLKSFVVPYPLAYLYSKPGPEVWAWLVVVLGCLCWLRSRYFAIYLLLLAPCLGFVTIPNMKLSLVSDHWAYLPDTFLVLVAAGWLGRIKNVRVGNAVATLVLCVCAVLSFEHSQTFATELGFWRHTLELNPQSAPATYNVAVALDKRNEFEEAARFYSMTVSLDPSHARAWNNLGRTQFLAGNLADARDSFANCIKAEPKITMAYLSLARVHMILLEPDKAREVLRDGLAANPGAADLQRALDGLSLAP